MHRRVGATVGDGARWPAVPVRTGGGSGPARAHPVGDAGGTRFVTLMSPDFIVRIYASSPEDVVGTHFVTLMSKRKEV